MTPEDFELPDGNPLGDHDDGDAKPAVFVTTREPISILVSRLDEPRAPDASALAAYIGGRLIARSAMAPEAIERLLELRLFEEPIPLGLFAYEEAPGFIKTNFADAPLSFPDQAAMAAGVTLQGIIRQVIG